MTREPTFRQVLLSSEGLGCWFNISRFREGPIVLSCDRPTCFSFLLSSLVVTVGAPPVLLYVGRPRMAGRHAPGQNHPIMMLPRLWAKKGNPTQSVSLAIAPLLPFQNAALGNQWAVCFDSNVKLSETQITQREQTQAHRTMLSWDLVWEPTRTY